MMLKFKSNMLFLIVVLLSVFTTILIKYLLGIDKLYYNYYSEKLVQEQVENIIVLKNKWEWIGYVIIPLLVLIRTNLVALCLSIGMFCYNMEHPYKFKQFFRITLLGEFVLVLVGFFKLGYFYFVKTDYNLLDLQQYFPLSYINFLDIDNIEPWLIYPLQTINLFEIAYFFVLAYGLWKLLKNNFSKSLEIAAVSYGSGLVVWLGIVMFFTLNMS